ncbi:MAG: nucleotidyltransferase family protein [Terracidiphilus sp.]|jgi:molybdenum cofactor cytidylyltransferase
MPVAAIVLAAGASRRLGQPKQLLMLGGEILVARAIRLAAEAGAIPVIAVLGAHHERISAAIDSKKMSNAIPVFNGDWQQGIATSIHAGVRALENLAPQASGALILGCDQPRLTAGHLRALLEAFAAQCSSAIVASAYAGVAGTPAVFPRAVFAELLALRGDQGARALLMKPPCPSTSLPFPGGEIDIDLPADLTEIE